MKALLAQQGGSPAYVRSRPAISPAPAAAGLPTPPASANIDATPRGENMAEHGAQFTPETEHVSALLERWSQGDAAALNALVPHLYGEIHAIATRQLRNERHLTIEPTALVHEVYLRLLGLSRLKLHDRTHFLSMAARIARQALVDEARQRAAQKRDGGYPVTLSDTNLADAGRPFDTLELEALLQELERMDAPAADVVTLRVFGGLSIEETAAALDVSVATVNRRWASGKAWLTFQLTGG